MNDVNLAWQSAVRQFKIISALAKLRAIWYRDALRPNVAAAYLANLKSIQAQGKHLDLEILQEAMDYRNPVGALKYANNKRFLELCGYSGNYPLSDIDTVLLQNRLIADLTRLRRSGINVEAFEVGNELDWVCFNTDLPIDKAAGNVPDTALLPFTRSYARFLQAVVSVIKQFYPQALVVSFGTANTPKNIPADAISRPGVLIGMLKDLDGTNYLNLIDRIGVHLYVDADRPEAASIALRDFMTDSQVDKPLWITEWGYPTDIFPTPSGRTRLQAFNDFFSAVKKSGVNVENMFNFAIDSTVWTLLDKGGNLLPEAAYFLVTGAPGMQSR